MNKELISGNFSKSAKHYDEHASIQRECAEKLIDFIGEGDFLRILEVGCGTGTYTRLLRSKYQGAEITAVDISGAMLDIARERILDDNISFHLADGERMPVGADHDLITSNASFQWFENPELSLSRFSDKLAGGGVMCFSMYGPDTYVELESVLQDKLGRRKWLSAGRFIDAGVLDDIMGRYFRKHEIREERFTVSFDSLWDFLRAIKRTGTRGYGLDIYLGKHAIRALEETYIEKYGSITATHQVYFCKARTRRN